MGCHGKTAELMGAGCGDLQIVGSLLGSLVVNVTIGAVTRLIGLYAMGISQL